MDLSGVWLAAEADDEIRRSGVGLDTDDTSWERITVPGHWHQHPKFASSDGPIMYRRSFRAPPPDPGRRRWLTLDGVFYQADVWLDGAYLGDPEGYFAPHTFDITTLSRIGDEHVVAVEVTCSPQASTSGRRNITGVFQPPRGMGTTINPGGLWRPVGIHETGRVRIDRLRVLCRDADERRAHLRIAARLDSDEGAPATVRTSIAGEVHDEVTMSLAAGRNEIEWNVDITDPVLWWPRALGEQHLVDVDVDVIVDGEVSDHRCRRTGLRQIAWDDWRCTVNGERLFLKGANLMPATALPAEATDELVLGDLTAAVDLGLDALRVYGHIADRRVYRHADELGLLLLQDFPLQWGHVRSVRGQAVAQARAAVDELGHHPSIASWTAHDDPTGADASGPAGGWSARARSMAAKQLPSWNRTVLDRWVKRALENADPTRQVVAHSGVVPHLPQLDGTDSHLWYGWRRGEPEDLARFAARLPRMVRFVSEFGSDSPPRDPVIPTDGWPELDWDLLESEYGYDRDVFERLFPPADYVDYDDWAATTQYYQSYLLKVQIESLRRLKYRPTGGFCLSRLNDPAPAISSSIIGSDRVPKIAYDAVRAACAPVLVVGDPLPDTVDVDEALSIDVHVVSDLRTALDFAVVDATVSWVGGERRWRFGGSVPADSVVKVGRIEFVVPDASGPLTIDLTMTSGDTTSANHDATIVV